MDGKVEKISSMYFNFDAGEAEFRGEKAIVKGSLLFDFLHEFREPNAQAVEEIGVQIKNWLEDHLRGSGSPEVLETYSPLLNLNARPLAFMQPDAYTRNQEDQITMRKGFWLALMNAIEWLADFLDDDEKYQKDPNFNKLCKFFSSTLFKIFSFGFTSKDELKIQVDQFELFKTYPKFYNVFDLWFDFAHEFYGDPLMQKCGISKKKMLMFGQVLEQQYMSNSWMDGAGLGKVDSFSLYALRRMQSNGGITQVTICAIMDGFCEPDLLYIFREQHVQHFTFLCTTIMGLVNELLSLKKELKAGEGNNLVLFWVKKGRSLQDSVNKAIKKHDQFLDQARNLYNFLQTEYKNDAKLLGYLDLILNVFSGICQFQGSFSERYGDVKWSIEQEKKHKTRII